MACAHIHKNINVHQHDVICTSWLCKCVDNWAVPLQRKLSEDVVDLLQIICVHPLRLVGGGGGDHRVRGVL